MISYSERQQAATNSDADDRAPAAEAYAGAESPYAVQFEDGQRAFFVGHTGSGKTFLATRYIQEATPWRLPVVVVDPKGLYPYQGWKPSKHDPIGWQLVDELPSSWERQIRREKRPHHLRLIVRPDFLDDPRQNPMLNDLYTRLDRAGMCLIYLDEIQALCHESRAHQSLSKLVQMGRAKFISVWGSTLRPAAIPRMFLSESDHIFAFRLRDDDDKDRIAEVIGADGKVAPGPGRFDFWYRPPGVDLERPILVHQTPANGE